jgi:hypothetical protein
MKVKDNIVIDGTIQHSDGGVAGEVFFTDGTRGLPAGGGGSGDANVNRFIQIYEDDLASVDAQGISDYLNSLSPLIDNSAGKNLYFQILPALELVTDSLVSNADSMDINSFDPATDEFKIYDTVTGLHYVLNLGVYGNEYLPANKSWRCNESSIGIHADSGTGHFTVEPNSPWSCSILIKLTDLDNATWDDYGIMGFLEDSTPSRNHFATETSVILPFQQWVNITAVQRTIDGVVDIYLDGVKVDSTPALTTPRPGLYTDPILLHGVAGADRTDIIDGVPGYEVKSQQIYFKALTDEEVMNNVNFLKRLHNV